MSYDGLGKGYDSWRMCMEDYDHEEWVCTRCDDTKEKWEHAKDFFDGIVEMIYGRKKYSPGELENMIDEVCHFFKMRLPQGEISIQAKSKMESVLGNWVEYNQKYLKDVI